MAHSLTSLAVFQCVTHKEMIRSLHVYESMEIEREFVFEMNSRYVEMNTKPLFHTEGFRRLKISEGSVIGSWQCIFLFRLNHSLPQFPRLLCLFSNPKLEEIPNLANDLKFISELKTKRLSKISDQEQCSGVQYGKCDQPKQEELLDCEVDQPKSRKLVLKQDLNCLPDSEIESLESENDKTEHSESDGKSEMLKKRRTPSKHVAGLSLEDLSKYFGIPIIEASKNLNIGLTILKKKCREFGIPRWPHRKIKSLDSLIHDLQEEAKKQQEKNLAAAIAVAKKQKILEKEKRNIVERPSMDIQLEIKRFRQVNFKKRHYAKKNEDSLGTTSSSTT